MKTSKLEDRYTKLLVLALWPEEPYEVHFFEKKMLVQKMVGKFRNMSENMFPQKVQNQFPWTQDTQISHLDNLFSISSRRYDVFVESFGDFLSILP